MDVAIFTREIAEGLIAKGFELVATTKKAWYFKEEVLLWAAIDELLEALEDSNR